MIIGAIKVKDGLFIGDELASKVNIYNLNLKGSWICHPEQSN